MAEPIHLLLAIHNHQPVGNFDDVFARAFKQCYWPVLQAFERHPAIKLAIHHSGPLIDWALEREGDYIDRLIALAMRGQVEIMGGGYYEPILPILKPTDALGQIEMMQGFWERRTGKLPKGMWLSERVWEPQLAALITDAGLAYTILDDEHFRHAGIIDDTLFGCFRTERAGKSISIFPSDKMLRYLIPFKAPEEVVGHLLGLKERHPGCAITYGDDGEKFGVWPGTYDWVIAKGWLERFLTALEKESGRITTTTFSEYLEMRQATGTVYLPTASYSEMLEWAMPAEAIVTYERTRKAIENAGLWGEAQRFFRGGFWDNFLTKYPESNLIHKRAIYASDRLDAAEAKGFNLKDARRSLYKAQCNCAYWHGLFGGLYLNYLRHALYQNIIDAEIAADKIHEGNRPFTRIEVLDIDRDGVEEALLVSDTLACIIRPQAGGGLASLDFRPKKFNLLNTLACRFEAYHELKAPSSHVGAGGNIPSIHELGKDIGELKNYLSYDRSPRYAFLDHAFDKEPNWDQILSNQIDDCCQFDSAPYRLIKWDRIGTDVRATLVAERQTPLGANLSVEKDFVLKQGGRLEVRYRWKHKGHDAPPPWLATEINFTLLAGHDKDRYYEWEGIQPRECLMDTRLDIGPVKTTRIVDLAFGFRATIDAAADHALVRPVETVSQSEKGFDLLYQGSTLWLAWRPKWSADGKTQFSVGIAIESI